MKTQIYIKTPPHNWYQILAVSPHATLYQTEAWGNYIYSSKIGIPIYITCTYKEKVVGMMLMWYEYLHHHIINRFPLIGSLISVFREYNLKFGYLNNGPIILDNRFKNQIFKSLFKQVDKIAHRYRIISMTILSDLALNCYKNCIQPEQNFIDQNFQSKQCSTLILELSGLDESNFMSIFKSSTRKDINKSIRQNLSFSILKLNELDQYHRLINENRQRIKSEYIIHMPTKVMLQNLALIKGIISFKIIKNNKIIAAMSLFCFNGISYQIASCQSNQSYYEKWNVNDLLVWGAINWAIKNQIKIYDLTGIPVYPTTKKEEGLLRYKKKWSDNRIDYFTYTKHFNKTFFYFLNLIKNMYNKNRQSVYLTKRTNIQ